MGIPRGSYKPVFKLRDVEAELAPERGVETPPQLELVAISTAEVKRPPSRIPFLTTLAIACMLAAACLILGWQNAVLRRAVPVGLSTPAVGKFWTRLLSARPNTDVILADTSFSLVEDITKKPVTLNAYLSRDYFKIVQSPELSPDRRDDLGLIIQRAYGNIGDFRTAQRIIGLDPTNQNIHLYYARDYTPALVTQDNLILIGSRKSNPWVDLFADKLNFTVQYDTERRISFVQNRDPKGSEQSVYAAPPAPGPSSGYGVVAFMPNPDQGGEVIILAGTGGEATEAAGEFLTSEQALASFKKQLGVSALSYFEVLLKTSHLNGTPINSEVIAYRTLPGRKK